MKILITGGNGYIAKSLYNGLKDKYDIITTTKQDFDLTDYKATRKWFCERYFDVVIHTATVGGSRLEQEDVIVVEQNVSMYNNLLANKQHFNKFITFGSGAEFFKQTTPYGISKNIITKSIKKNNNFYNLRIFATFDHNELDTRFIKANILRYINKQPMLIHTNKIMDFFYMQDLINLVDYYISNNNPPKEINCSYETKYTLKNIADIINRLDTHKVEIIIENKNELQFYCGESSLFPINILGLEYGVKNTFKKLYESANKIS